MHINGHWNTLNQRYQSLNEILPGYAIDDGDNILLPVFGSNELNSLKSIRKSLNDFKKSKTRKHGHQPTIIASNIGPIAKLISRPPISILILFKTPEKSKLPL